MQVLITLGSNIDREQNIDEAIAQLERSSALRILAVSPVYVTLAIGPDGELAAQAAFSNAAIRAETALDPTTLRDALRTLEAAMGRVRTSDKFAPRPIDLDIAFYGDETTEVAGKTIPDSDVLRFAHVAAPLADVAGDWIHPQTGQTLAEIAACHSVEKLEKIS
ncbi:MAG: 2-amino-4-hydroxy-6-hydroxymethyldihydropteridine diphosphokinase [Caldilineaceae bacterium]|jgi:2-amino-4-hydroxy-6-hydroxymethyldihydropteridine diphosphokinase|nr:2-amino-4-hydroxy-6-hydroxymethyldihydropteridine diphosphokinase [Caldilineaceae bacterium]